MGRRKLVAGNWKMHGTSADLGEVAVISIAAETAEADVALCLPATLIERAVRSAPGFAIGGQDLHPADKGGPYRLRLGGHADRRRRPADDRWP